MSWARITVGMCAGLTIAFVVMLEPVSAAAFVGFAVWMTLPHLCLLTIMAPREPEIFTRYAPAVMFGMRPDAQGAMGIVSVPLFQWAAIAVFFVIATILRHSNQRDDARTPPEISGPQ